MAKSQQKMAEDGKERYGAVTDVGNKKKGILYN